MSDSKPLPTFADRRVSRRRLLALGATVPAAVVLANALPGRISTSAAPQSPAVTGAGAASVTSPALTGPAYCFC